MMSFVSATTTVDTTPIEKIMPPVYGSDKTYVYDKEAVKKIMNEESNLVEVSCQSDDVLRALWLQKNTLALTTIGFTKENMDMNIDFKNCMLYAGRSVWIAPSQWISDQKALSSAKTFVTTTLGANGIVKVPQLDKPYIAYRDNGGMMYPLAAAKEKGSSVEHLETLYNSVTIVYPYIVNGKALYSNYGGWKMWVSITVDSNGISSVHVPLLAFTSVPKTAEQVSDQAALTLIDNGGNNPYYGAEQTVTLEKPERVLVYFNYYVPNAPQRTLISDGIRLGSQMKQDQWNPLPYEMILSDFVIGNTNNAVMLPYMKSSDMTVTEKKVVKRPLPKIRLKTSQTN